MLCGCCPRPSLSVSINMRIAVDSVYATASSRLRKHHHYVWLRLWQLLCFVSCMLWQAWLNFIIVLAGWLKRDPTQSWDPYTRVCGDYCLASVIELHNCSVATNVWYVHVWCWYTLYMHVPYCNGYKYTLHIHRGICTFGASLEPVMLKIMLIYQGLA